MVPNGGKIVSPAAVFALLLKHKQQSYEPRTRIIRSDFGSGVSHRWSRSASGVFAINAAWPITTRSPFSKTRVGGTAGGGSSAGKASRSSFRAETIRSRRERRAPSRKPYFSRNECSMGKMLLKGRFKVLENRS